MALKALPKSWDGAKVLIFLGSQVGLGPLIRHRVNTVVNVLPLASRPGRAPESPRQGRWLACFQALREARTPFLLHLESRPVARTRPFLLWVLGWVLCACHPEALRPSPSGEALRYHVTYVREPQHALDVELVLVGSAAPRDFLFTRAGGVSQVTAVSSEGVERVLPVSAAGEVVLPSSTRLLRYRYVLEGHGHGGHSDFITGMGEGEAWHVAGRAWLLRPRTVTPSLRAALSVEGVDALLPWAPDAGGVYHLRGADLVDSGFHGFGGRRCTVRPSGAEVEVMVLGHFSRLEDAALCGWVAQAAREVLTVRRSFPYPRVTVRIIAVPGHASPVFGMVLWSLPPSITLLMGQDAGPEALPGDWVAVHELLHLSHPIFVPHVAWLSEGLSTYLTELARARSGRQTPERAWEELLAGFNRGREAVGSRTMKDVVTREDSYMGTYWTGALFCLHLDVELRRVTGGARSLEDVLGRLAAPDPTGTLEDFGAAVDAAAGRPLFQALLARHLSQPAFAELDALLQRLGVEPHAQAVQLVNAPDSQVREALVARHSESL